VEGFVKVARKDEVAPGKMKLVEVGSEQIVLANVNGTLLAFTNVCTHAQCDLAFGALAEEEVECDCHGSRFNVRTGAVLNGPATEPLALYSVRTEGQDLLVGPAG
jgi:3-phenylpropionate/trans-cinnamate dioxygenase ferredoxin subunit